MDLLSLKLAIFIALILSLAAFADRVLKPWLKKRRARISRARYEFLKAEISRRHFEGYAGLTVDYPGRRFTREDINCFRPPMYQTALNKDGKPVIFWHREKLTKEIGTGAPLREGEVNPPEKPGRFNIVPDIDSVDARKG